LQSGQWLSNCGSNFLPRKPEAELSNKVEFTGLPKQAIRLRTTVDANIAKVLDHGQFIMGPEVREFEQKLTEFCGAKHAITCANGTDALQIALMAAKIGLGDAVFVPSFTYTATAEVILVLGAIPVFVEVEAHSFNIDPVALKAAIVDARADGLVPRAVITVDLFGLPAACDAVCELAEIEGLFYLSDAAQGFGAKLADGRSVGTLAPVTTTSFFPAKPLGCYGDGGAIFTDDDDLANIMRSIRVHGQGAAKYETVRVGMNSRLDTMQAAVLNAKIDVFAEETARRNALADQYEARLSNIVTTPKKPEGIVSAWAQYTIRVVNRDAVIAALKVAGIPTAVYYPQPMHLQPAYAAYGKGAGSMPLSEQLSREVLSLPMNPYWVQDDLDAVCNAVASVVADLAPAT
jgi:UDP-2-acetamido-2-deoxy-ribo-hexuluronate aminotransferase